MAVCFNAATFEYNVDVLTDDARMKKKSRTIPMGLSFSALLPADVFKSRQQSERGRFRGGSAQHFKQTGEDSRGLTTL